MMKTKTKLLLFVFSMVALCFTCWTVYGQKQTASRINWEYTTLMILYSDSDKMIPLLNAQGTQGWEVIQAKFRPDPGDTHMFFLLKRPK